MNPIYFSQKPYVVTYKDFNTGNIVKVKRRPPPLNHDMLPTDVVELSVTKNQEWQQGDEKVIKHINYRHPNTLQLQNDNGDTTFVSSAEVKLVRRGNEDASDTADAARRNRYLVWP